MLILCIFLLIFFAMVVVLLFMTENNNYNKYDATYKYYKGRKIITKFDLERERNKLRSKKSKF